jgi:hypothetical protein
MAEKSTILSQLAKEKQDLTRAIDKSPNNEDLQRQMKNLCEKIRYHQNKVSVTPAAKIPTTKEANKIVENAFSGKDETKNLKVYEIVALGMKQKLKAKEIASKYELNVDSVRWYMSKIRLGKYD